MQLAQVVENIECSTMFTTLDPLTVTTADGNEDFTTITWLSRIFIVICNTASSLCDSCASCTVHYMFAHSSKFLISTTKILRDLLVIRNTKFCESLQKWETTIQKLSYYRPPMQDHAMAYTSQSLIAFKLSDPYRLISSKTNILKIMSKWLHLPKQINVSTVKYFTLCLKKHPTFGLL